MSGKPGSICILTGPPGSGKTTAAGAWAAMPGVPKVHLHADDFWHFIKAGSIPPYLPEADAQNAIVVDVLASVAQRYASGGYLVIVDGIIGPRFLAPFQTLTVPIPYIVLRPVLDAAIKRCRRRDGDTLTDPAVIADLHRQFEDIGPLNAHRLDTGTEDREAVLRSILAASEDSRFLLM